MRPTITIDGTPLSREHVEALYVAIGSFVTITLSDGEHDSELATLCRLNAETLLKLAMVTRETPGD